MRDSIEYKAARGFNRVVEGEGIRQVKGFPSITGVLDAGRDIVLSGAFKKTLKENGERLKWLWAHKFQEPPVALIASMEEVPRRQLPKEIQDEFSEATGGLIAIRQYLTDTHSDRIYQGIKAGTITELSIGLDPKDYYYEDKDGNEVSEEEIYTDYNINFYSLTRFIKQARLWEGSDVNWGMNPATVNIKSMGAYLDLPLAPLHTPWSSSAAKERIKEHCGTPEIAAKYFMYHNALDVEGFKGLHIPIVDIVKGQPVIIPQALFSISYKMDILKGLIPHPQLLMMRQRLTGYYGKMGRKAPWQMRETGLNFAFDAVKQLYHQVTELEGTNEQKSMLADLLKSMSRMLNLGLPEGATLEKAGLPFLNIAEQLTKEIDKALKNKSADGDEDDKEHPPDCYDDDGKYVEGCDDDDDEDDKSEKNGAGPQTVAPTWEDKAYKSLEIAQVYLDIEQIAT